MVLNWPFRSPSQSANQRRALVATILGSFLQRPATPDEIEAHEAGLPASGEPAECVAVLLARFNTPTAPRFVPPGHHYSPIPPTAEVEGHFARFEGAPVVGAVAGIDIDRETMLALWSELLPALHSHPFGAEARPPLRYRFDNPAYSWGDGAILTAMLRRLRPRRIIEIGCGWSTLCTLDTIEHSLDGACHLTLIEPFPDLVRDLVGTGRAPDVLLESRVQDVPLATFDALEPNDVLFIDSTHVVRTGSDVCHEFFEILPRLRPGVVVHLHDIFWPFEYPREWAVTDNRSWSEIYLLRAFLTANPEWRVLMFNDYLFKCARDRIEKDYPPFLHNPGGAIWLKKEAEGTAMPARKPGT